MATVPTTTTWATAKKISAALLNLISTGIAWFLSDKPLCQVRQSTAQTGWSSGAATAVTFTTEDIDRDGQHSNSTNTSRINIGNTLGWYRVAGVYVSAGNTATVQVRVYLAKNGTLVPGSMAGTNPASASGALAVPTPSMLIEATDAADYVELMGVQFAGSGTIGTAVGSPIMSTLNAEWIGT